MKVIMKNLVKNNQKNKSDAPLLPHERDEAADPLTIVPRKKMKLAYQDLQRGLVDTDMHGQRGVECVLKKTKKNNRQK